MVTMPSGTRRLLHVTNGASAADTIGAAGIPGVRSIWADSLHDGPVPGGITDRELLEVRARYHAAPPEESFAEQVKGLTEWRQVMERGGYDELVLWFEHESDTSLADLAEGFSRMSPPLVTRDRNPGSNSQRLTGSVTITPAGAGVLRGREDRVAVYGIDRWMGGVHLQSGTNLWRWDDTRGQVVPDTARTP